MKFRILLSEQLIRSRVVDIEADEQNVAELRARCIPTDEGPAWTNTLSDVKVFTLSIDPGKPAPDKIGPSEGVSRPDFRCSCAMCSGSARVSKVDKNGYTSVGNTVKSDDLLYRRENFE